MIIWIASYPKSGNTWVRALIAHYFFSKNEKFDFKLLKNIPNFNVSDFINEKTPLKSNNDVIKNWLPTQNFINKKFKRNLLFKTHNACIERNGNKFTNGEVSAGCIYIVRDPRNVITSYKNFENQTYKDVAKNMFDNNGYLSSNESTFKKFGIKGIEIISSWAENYNSWVHNKYNIPVCLIKYEDLCSNPSEEFKRIFEFLKKINKEKENQLNDERLRNTIEETNFENLKTLEEMEGFVEKQKREVIFFNQGKKNNWKEILPKKISSEIEKKFSKEMEELGYL
tara:strand:- start:165 stop:1013 length:849 start_codon:yes stop_codon:yes gene_type:complete